MSIDLTKLTPAPWEASDETYERRWGVHAAGWLHIGVAHHPDSPHWNEQHDKEEADAKFIALARNDLDVKQRRGWHTEKCTEADQWFVPQLVEVFFRSQGTTSGCVEAGFQDKHDVGLLTKADRWYRENVEKS